MSSLTKHTVYFHVFSEDIDEQVSGLCVSLLREDLYWCV